METAPNSFPFSCDAAGCQKSALYRTWGNYYEYWCIDHNPERKSLVTQIRKVTPGKQFSPIIYAQAVEQSATIETFVNYPGSATFAASCNNEDENSW